MDEKLEFSVKQIYSKLRKSEQKAADYLLEFQGDCQKLTLEKFAEEADVSQPTVLRFVRALGYEGFKEFRFVLVQNDKSKISDHILYGYPIFEKDRIGDVPGKVVGTAISQLKDTLKSISPDILEKSINAIVSAERIYVYYVENSSCTANDFITKLMYLGINCCSYSDYYMQNVSAANLTEKDLAIGISYSGYSRNTVDAMKAARKSGARTIAITNFENSLIHKYADIILCTSNHQYIYGNSIFSRVSQLAVVDMIYTGILLSDYPKYTKTLDNSSKLIKHQAYDDFK